MAKNSGLRTLVSWLIDLWWLFADANEIASLAESDLS